MSDEIEKVTGYVPDVDVGTRSWANRVRKEAKELAEQVETGYLKLGEILYRIYDAPFDGDPKNGPLLARWGYKSVGEFAEAELQLHAKKAQRLVRIFYRVEVELKGFEDPELHRRFLRLGWSKARELVRIINNDNAQQWIERAEKANYTTISELVRQENRRLEALRINNALADEVDPVEESNDLSIPASDAYALESPLVDVVAMPLDIGDHTVPAPKKPTPVSAFQQQPQQPVSVVNPPHIKVSGEAAKQAAVERRKLASQVLSGESFSDSDETWVTKTFKVNASQAETVNLALKRAQDLAGNIQKTPSSLLALICLDFLSSADWQGNDLVSKLRFLAKIENSLGGLRLVVVDDTNTVVFGLRALRDAAARMQEATEEES